ncbi:hypothetical protein BH18THE1_BH18THE1_03270 [soil metagenome]
MWNYRSPEDSGLQKGFDYLLPYALGKEPWLHEQIKPIDKTTLFNLLSQATVPYEDNEFKEALHSIDLLNETMEINGLIYGCICRS